MGTLSSLSANSHDDYDSYFRSGQREPHVTPIIRGMGGDPWTVPTASTATRLSAIFSEPNADMSSQGFHEPSEPKPLIRPVVVDDSGRIFEMTGEQIRMPGLEPQDVLDTSRRERGSDAVP